MQFHKGTSPTAEKYVTMARAVLYSAKSIPVLKQIITGAKTLELGAAPFLATTYMHLLAKLGPLNDKKDQVMLVMHMAKDVADIAHELHDPAAKDPVRAAMKIVQATARILAGQHPATGAPTGGPPGAPPPGGPPLAQMQPQGGMQ